MGHIKEPKGVDFVIKSDPLTDEAREEISEYIRNYKKAGTKKKAKATNVAKKQKVVNA